MDSVIPNMGACGSKGTEFAVKPGNRYGKRALPFDPLFWNRQRVIKNSSGSGVTDTKQFPLHLLIK